MQTALRQAAPIQPAPEGAQCALCGLDCGPRPVAHRDRDFCCLGCMNVYSILEESGALAGGVHPRDTELFKNSLEMGLISTLSGTGRAAKVQIPEGAEVREMLLQVGGMWCSACGWLIEHSLEDEPGILKAEVMFAADLVRVRYCPQYLPPSRAAERIRALGYRAEPFEQGARSSNAERRDLLLRAGVAGFLWMNVMTFSTIFYVSYFEYVTENFRRLMPFVLLALTAPAVFYSAWPILRAAWIGLRQGILRMETLLSLGIVAAYVYSGIQAVNGGKHFYFDTACAIITLVLLGKLIERSAKERTTAAISGLYRMMPSKARVMQQNRERFVSVDNLQEGDQFLVKAGERVPVDGDVVTGFGHMDESVLTGESRPVGRGPGDAVLCGSLSTDAALTVRATRVGSGTTLAQVLQSVEQALATRSTMERNVDKVARTFIPVVIVISLITFAVWAYWRHEPGAGLINAIAVLVIACPCALGLATPLAISSAIHASARRGVLVNHAQALETISRLDLVIFDKTGTITHGDFELLDFTVCNARWEDALAFLASLESRAEHPLARAILQEAGRLKVQYSEPFAVQRHEGSGITGTVWNHEVFAGNRRLVADLNAAISDEVLNAVLRWESQGRTVVIFGWDQTVKAAASFGDRVREEAASVVAALNARDVATMILSGDAEGPTKAVAAQVGAAEYRAQITPAGKIDLVRKLQSEGKVVAMIGDGVNDAPALAQADLGIAMGCGTALAMRAAPLVLMGSSLEAMLGAIELARRALRVVKVNLFWAFFYNALGLTLAATGILNPILAAGAMVLSSMSVVANSVRLDRSMAAAAATSSSTPKR